LKQAKSIGVSAAAWVVWLIAPLSWAGQRPPDEIRSAAQSVTLFAQLPTTAGVAGLIRAVPQTLLGDGQTAEMVVLQESWTLARGQTLDAECQVMTEPHATAEVFTSKPQNRATSLVSPASFLETRRARTFPLVTDFDPARGFQWDTQILLIVQHIPGETSSASVRITVVAL
jgi:hypothetical protein